MRVSLRLLWKDRAFTATAALTLAVCIGANAALFSVVRGVLLKPLALPDADRVVMVGNAYPGAGVHEPIGSAVPDYFDRLRDITAFDEQALFKQDNRSIDQGGVATRVESITVTPSIFTVAGVPPQIGRMFTDEEGEIGHESVVVLSDGFWRSQFGGDRSAIGRELRIDGRPHTVVGVMPPGFRPTDDDTAMWTPMTFTAKEKSDEQRHSNNAVFIARLKPGATVQQAQRQIDALNAANLERFPQLKEVLINAGFHTVVARLQDQMVEDIRPILYLMWGGAAFVLLIGCVNVANLVLVRSRVRLKELATRLALGAGTSRVARQLAVEHVLLTLGSAAVGVAIGFAALRAMDAINLQDLPRAQEIRLDAVVIDVHRGRRGRDWSRARSHSGCGDDECASAGCAARRRSIGNGQPRRAITAARVGGGAGRMRVRAADWCRPAVYDVPQGAGGRPRDSCQTGVLTAAVSLPDARYPDDGGTSAVHRRGAAAHTCACPA